MSALPPLLPYLTVSDGAAAIAFYKKAFGAVEHELHHAPGSTKIMNAHLSINGGVFMLSDDFSAQFGGASSRCRPRFEAFQRYHRGASTKYRGSSLRSE